MVVVAIIVGATIYFVYPLRQATDVTVRATLTDIADNALQRIGRDVRFAPPAVIAATAARQSPRRIAPAGWRTIS